MPDREFIHSSTDVATTLLHALQSGMRVLLDAPQPEPCPHMLTEVDVTSLTEGSFYLFRPEWVYGPFQTMAISDGRNRGKYFVQPRVNYAPISIYFSGERMAAGRRRLGSGVLSYHRDWLALPAKELRSTPAEVAEWFKRIAAHLFSGVIVKAGAHRYRISRSVQSNPSSAECLPPFDFIPWGKDPGKG